MILGKDGIERLPPPVGTSDWVRFSRTSYCVDKTLILKDLIDSQSTVVLFTRPRRFGKTTMLKMIRAFYEPETLVDGRGMVKTEEFFTDKKIWAAGEKYRAEQGKRPVIFLSFKDVKQRTAESAFEKIVAVVSSEVNRHRHSVENGWGDADFRASGLADIEKIGLAYYKNKVELRRASGANGGGDS